MVILTVQLGGSGPAMEKKLIEFIKGCKEHSRKVWNKKADARGLPKHGTTYMYCCFDRRSVNNEAILLNLIE